jgi:hypothetical protein
MATHHDQTTLAGQLRPGIGVVPTSTNHGRPLTLSP